MPYHKLKFTDFLEKVKYKELIFHESDYNGSQKPMLAYCKEYGEILKKRAEGFFNGGCDKCLKKIKNAFI